MVVVSDLIADTGDAKLHRIGWLLSRIRPLFELGFHSYVADLSAELSHNVSKTLLGEGNGAPVPFP